MIKEIDYKRLAKLIYGLEEKDDKKDKDAEGGLAKSNQISPESPERDIEPSIPKPTPASAPSAPTQAQPTAQSQAVGMGAAQGQAPGQLSQPGKDQQQQTAKQKEKSEKQTEKDFMKIGEPEKLKPKTALGKFVAKHLNESVRKKISREQAKAKAGEAKWQSFEDWVKQFPRKRPSFWFDGGLVYATISDYGSERSFHLTGSYSLQDATHMSLSKGGRIHTTRDREETEFSDQKLTPHEIKIIDKHAKRILMFAKRAFSSKPFGMALRLIERYLERMGIPNSHSGEIADVIAKAFNKDKAPKSTIYHKVRSRIQPRWNPLNTVTPDTLQGM